MASSRQARERGDGRLPIIGRVFPAPVAAKVPEIIALFWVAKILTTDEPVWRERFGSDPNIVGQKLVLDAQPFTVVGVMSQGVQHPGSERAALAHGAAIDVWWPFTFTGDPGNRVGP